MRLIDRRTIDGTVVMEMTPIEARHLRWHAPKNVAALIDKLNGLATVETQEQADMIWEDIQASGYIQDSFEVED